MTEAKPFAERGCEKMIYDARMGPQAVCHKGKIYIVYQANPDGLEGHPHIRAYDISSRSWSDPVQLNTVRRRDHHLAPVLWFDHNDHLHVLYGCHGNPGTHLVSIESNNIERWETGPKIDTSISYPRFLPLPDGRLLLFNRTFGHMGYWGYRLSADGGFTWGEIIPLIDFDQKPNRPEDVWAGSYANIELAPDGRNLYIGFVYWDERKKINPLYGREMGNRNRYHLYYAKLTIESGELWTIDGEQLPTPLSRTEAEACKVWDTGHRITNIPAISNDASGNPCFLLPVSEESEVGRPFKCRYYFIRRIGEEWVRQPITDANNTWDNCLLDGRDPKRLVAALTTGDLEGEDYFYGGGTIERWTSEDQGASWSRAGIMNPDNGLLFNNPKPVLTSNGAVLEDYMVMYGFPRDEKREQNNGKAYLWGNGEWL